MVTKKTTITQIFDMEPPQKMWPTPRGMAGKKRGPRIPARNLMKTLCLSYEPVGGQQKKLHLGSTYLSGISMQYAANECGAKG
jgi:hypothetical protein